MHKYQIIYIDSTGGKVGVRQINKWALVECKLVTIFFIVTFDFNRMSPLCMMLALLLSLWFGLEDFFFRNHYYIILPTLSIPSPSKPHQIRQ